MMVLVYSRISRPYLAHLKRPIRIPHRRPIIIAWYLLLITIPLAGPVAPATQRDECPARR
jgi:hypothetical protein